MGKAHYEYIGKELLNPDATYWEKWKYRIDFRCNVCGDEYSVVSTTVPRNDPPCPNTACQAKIEAEERIMRDRNGHAILSSGKFPGIGGKSIVKVVDKVAEDTMALHHMTDLKDNLRMGDTMAPTLPGGMQQMADNLFTPEAVKAPNGATISSREVQNMRQSAISGAYSGMAVGPKEVLGSAYGQKGLTHVRNEKV